MCLWVSNKKKYEKINFFASLKSLKKGVGSRVGSGSGAASESGSGSAPKCSGSPTLIISPVMQDLISLFQPEIRPDNLRPLALLLELLTVIPEEFSTLLLPSQKRAQVASSCP
jgi:hypothetical protein